MSNSLKVTLYAALVLLAGVSGYFALTNFGQMMSRAGERHSALEQIEPERKPSVEEPVPATLTTNLSTNAVAAAVSNAIAGATNALADVLTNTNAIAVVQITSNGVSNEVTSPAEPKTIAKSASTQSQSKTSGHVGLWTALFIVAIIGLGLLIASDLSHYFGNRALKVLYNDEGDGPKAPEYDKAEEVWANGDHLEAIKIMREYLAKNPREQHVAIRIAEIYEKDLKNNLAAALEYEEVLKHKLNPERWGWSAIHLCNLYFRLNQEQKGFELLRRIVNEYPNTAAADKARKRLEQVEGSFVIEQIATEQQVSTQARSSGGASSLPPGFRPKK